MATAFDPSVYEDTKIKETLEMLSQGISKEDIANHFGNKDWKSVYIYFNRKGFRWEEKENTFVPKEAEIEVKSAVEDARLNNTKAGKIIRQIGQKHANIRQIAQKNGFPTVEEMGEYMKGQGFVWNADQNNYIYDDNLALTKQTQNHSGINLVNSVSQLSGDRYQSLLEFLLGKQEKLIALLDTESDGTLPRYKFRGAKANKTLGLPMSLQTLLSDFSDEFNVTQRDIIEIALAEFFKKYGYEEQLNNALQA